MRIFVAWVVWRMECGSTCDVTFEERDYFTAYDLAQRFCRRAQIEDAKIMVFPVDTSNESLLG